MIFEDTVASKLVRRISHSHEMQPISYQVALVVNFREYPDMKKKDALTQRLEHALTEKFGGMVGGADLAHLLGYRSADTLRKAVSGNSLTLRTFFVPGRQGRFALTVEVADWLIELRQGRKTFAAHDQELGLHQSEVGTLTQATQFQTKQEPTKGKT